ncbi:hypothetical protein FJT64_015976 [Amphibalanus amphitrite]|uniref:Uncharacterized protein n=1 Tax=Amphibalanus amphitrite TaxID=1232801 RepID=A0A6A4X7R7_AMPAM|nr:hypothetical protein FJT64_015976 [Amphibalanus amphitrite]
MEATSSTRSASAWPACASLTPSRRAAPSRPTTPPCAAAPRRRASTSASHR